MFKIRVVLAASVAAAVALAVLAAAPAASAQTPPTAHGVASGLLSPLSIDVAANGTTYVSENFAGKIVAISKSGHKRTRLALTNGAEVGAVSRLGKNLVYGVTVGGCDTCEGTTNSQLRILKPNGHTKLLAKTGLFEKLHNPDRNAKYGFVDVPADCAAKWTPAQTAAYGPMSHTGVKDSHPYATAVDGKTVYLADAAGNDILKINSRGHISVVAVLPPVKTVITAEWLAANTDPSVPVDPCFVGKTYVHEPVPTGIKLGAHHKLYVSTLGSEDGSAPASIYRISTKSKHVSRIATGLPMASGLAVTKKGTVYVATLFAGMIMKIKPGKAPTVFAQANQVAALDIQGKYLYATKNVLVGTEPGGQPGGKVVRYKIG